MQNKSKSAAKTVSAETKAALVGSVVPAENAVIDAAIVKAKTEADAADRKRKTEALQAKRLAAQPKADEPEAKPEAPATDAKPEAKAESEATEPRGLARDATGVVRNATNFDTYSDRDTAYLRFFGSVMRQHGNTATLKQIFDAGSKRDKKSFNPHYIGSAKATDVGAINRLKKAGYITASPDGNTLTATKLAIESKAYNG